MKRTFYSILTLILILFIGCGKTDIKKNTTSDFIIKKGFTLERIECLNDSLEAGREVVCNATILDDSSVTDDENLSIRYYLTNSKGTQSTILGIESFTSNKGSFTYKSKFILPTLLKSDSYEVTGFIFSTELAELDRQNKELTKEEKENYQRLYSRMKEKLKIKANDGKPDLELLSLSINNTKIQNKQISKKSTPPLLTFDIGVVKTKVILNNKERIFNGTIDISSFIADAKKIKLSACLEVDGSCEKIKFYRVDNSKIIKEREFIVDSVVMQEPKTILFNASVHESLLKKIAKLVLEDTATVVKLKVTLFGVNQSATEDKSKNHIEGILKFAPIILSNANIDNNHDIVAKVLPDFKLKSSDYVLKLYEVNKNINPVTPVYNNPVNINNQGFINHITGINIPSTHEDSVSESSNNIELPQVISSTVVVKNTPQQLLLEPLKVSLQDISKLSLGTVLVPIHAIDLSALDPNSVSTDVEKVFGEEFKFDEQGKYFGIQATIGANAKFNKKGVETRGKGVIKAKLFGYNFTPLSITSYAGIKPASFNQTGYNYDVKVVGFNLYTKGKYLSEVHTITESSASDVGKKVKENKKKVKAYLDSTQKITLFSYEKGYSKTATLKKSKTLMIGPIPVVIGAYAKGTVGLDFGGAIVGLSEVTVSAIPYGELEAGAHGGIGASDIFSVGVEGVFTLIKESLIANVTGTLSFIENEASDKVVLFVGTLKETIRNVLEGPKGKINLYVDYPYAKICYTSWGSIPYPCGTTKRARFNLASFSSRVYDTLLLEKEQTLFRVRLQ